MIKKASLLALVVTISLGSKSQDLSLYQKKWMVQGGDTLPYRVLLPVDYDSAKSYPIIFFLHGAGERGRDNEKQLVHGSRLFLKEEIRNNYKAIVVFPQCPVWDYWSNVLRVHDANSRDFYFLEEGPPNRYMILLEELVTFVLNHYPVKKDQVYVGGLSMGGMGTFELVKRMPGVFAAAFPICGGADPLTAVKMKKVSWWVFHGGKDNVVLPFHSENMAKALKKAGAKVKFTLYPEANHNSWDAAFAEPELIPWLFSQKKQ
ncbi:MAG TPA: prolyl oligopeptidase family serine peptidase [Chitinophagaceae bacterium]|nr:prolyl oligopeptidase family serine peptidase [Chitinophagaceae bacterium]